MCLWLIEAFYPSPSKIGEDRIRLIKECLLPYSYPLFLPRTRTMTLLPQISRGIHNKTRSLPIPRVPTSIRKRSSLDSWTSHFTQHNRHHLNLKQALLLENGVLYACACVCFVFSLAAVLSNCFTFCHQLFIYLPIYLFISICLSFNVLHIPNIFCCPSCYLLCYHYVCMHSCLFCTFLFF